MIEKLLPPGVVGAEVFEHRTGEGLFPLEEALVARVVTSRRVAFTAGRVCARAALARLGRPPVAIGAGPRGEPCWPDRVVGSLTHCAGYAAAVVAESSGYRALGVDAEPHLELPDGVLDVVALPSERAWVAELACSRAATAWDRLLFCAKEAVYKAWYPLAGRWLGFEDATVSVDPEAETFSCALSVPGPAVDGRRLTGFTGRWLVRSGLVVTLVAVEVRGAPPPRDPIGSGGFPQVPDFLS